MVSREYVEQQFMKLKFDYKGWGRQEVNELPNIILPDEEIYEVANGLYEGGFAMLLATDIRVLLVDKKPMSFLTVEDLRFDMINEIDYNHRMFVAYITIATGNKTMLFRSYNKPRLRKLIGHVQHCMAEMKKSQSTHAQGQSQHLERINQQLQDFLMAQHKQQQELQAQLNRAQAGMINQTSLQPIEPVKPSRELSDYLYAKGLLARYAEETGKELSNEGSGLDSVPSISQELDVGSLSQADNNLSTPSHTFLASNANQTDEIFAEGIREVFGKYKDGLQHIRHHLNEDKGSVTLAQGQSQKPVGEVSPFNIAYAKLPLMTRSRRFGIKRQSLAEDYR